VTRKGVTVFDVSTNARPLAHTTLHMPTLRPQYRVRSCRSAPLEVCYCCYNTPHTCRYTVLARAYPLVALRAIPYNISVARLLSVGCFWPSVEHLTSGSDSQRRVELAKACVKSMFAYDYVCFIWPTTGFATALVVAFFFVSRTRTFYATSPRSVVLLTPYKVLNRCYTYIRTSLYRVMAVPARWQRQRPSRKLPSNALLIHDCYRLATFNLAWITSHMEASHTVVWCSPRRGPVAFVFVIWPTTGSVAARAAFSFWASRTRTFCKIATTSPRFVVPLLPHKVLNHCCGFLRALRYRFMTRTLPLVALTPVANLEHNVRFTRSLPIGGFHGSSKHLGSFRQETLRCVALVTTSPTCFEMLHLDDHLLFGAE
jgi:hypothetical protein